MASPPAYPVYRSPDGESEQVASTPAREVELKFAGWLKVTRPRRRTAVDARQQKPTPPETQTD